MCTISTSGHGPPERGEIKRHSQHRPQIGNFLYPRKPARQFGIDGHECRLEFRVLAPVANKEIGLNRLAAYIAK